MDYIETRAEEPSLPKEKTESNYIPARIDIIGTVASVTHGSRDVTDDDGSGYKYSK